MSFAYMLKSGMNTDDNDGEAYSRLSIEIGGEVTLEFEGLKKYFKTQLVGMEPGKYIIVKSPNAIGVHTLAISGAYLVMRFIGNGYVYGFTCKVISKTTVPAPILFLTYPATVKKIPLRKTPRYECLIPAKAHLSDRTFEGLMLNISEGGCKFTARIVDYEYDTDAPVNVDDRLTISFQMPCENETHTYMCTTRHVEFIDNKFIAGLQFNTADEASLARIRNFLLVVADQRMFS